MDYLFVQKAFFYESFLKKVSTFLSSQIDKNESFCKAFNFDKK